MFNYLVVHALAENSTGCAPKFLKLSKISGCNIVDSHFRLLGQEATIALLLAGTWDAIVKAEGMLDKLASEDDNLHIHSKRTTLEESSSAVIPYEIDVIGVDKPGVIADIVDFIVSNEIAMRNLYSSTYLAPDTNTKMFSLHMIIHLPLENSISNLRSRFLEFCDHCNIDAIMEPLK